MTRMFQFGAVAAFCLGIFSMSVSCQDDAGSGSDNGSSNPNGPGPGGGATGPGGSGPGGSGSGASGGTSTGIPGAETICDDGIDNDNDNFTDCDDFDCQGTATCPAPVENSDALCGNNMDDDADGLMDCEDDSCHGHPDVTVCVEDCATMGDEDENGFADCEDRACFDTPACLAMGMHQEAGTAECTDDIDNDGDGFFDCADNSCRATNDSCVEGNETINNCSDGLDNNSSMFPLDMMMMPQPDWNRFVDCDAGTSGGDFECEDWGYCPATISESTTADCSDGADNDSDMFSDCDDFSCQNSHVQRVCDGNAVTCSDGIDNDGDGFTDCGSFACRCCPGEGDNCSFQQVASTCAPCTQ